MNTALWISIGAAILGSGIAIVAQSKKNYKEIVRKYKVLIIHIMIKQ